MQGGTARNENPAEVIPPGHFLILGEGQAVDAVDHRALVGTAVGVVAGELPLAVKGGEDHAVAAVHALEQGRKINRPVAVDSAVIRAGQDLHIAGVVKACPQAHEFAVMTEQERSVGDILACLSTERTHGRGVAGFPQFDGFGNGVVQVIAELDGADGAVANLDPFVAEDHPGLAVLVYMQSTVQAHPVAGGHGAVGVGTEGTHGRVGHQNGSAAVDVGGDEGGEHIELALVHMDFRRPEVDGTPETGLGLKNGMGFAPGHQVGAGVDIKAGVVEGAGAVEVVNAFVGQDERVTHMDLVEFHKYISFRISVSAIF